MSKWDAFSKGGESAKESTKSSISGGLFTPGTTSTTNNYQQGTTAINPSDAAAKVTRQIQQNFAMCDRLPKQPVFQTADGEVDVKDGVMGAMGTVAAELLDLAQTQELSASLGLGSSSGATDDSEQDD